MDLALPTAWLRTEDAVTDEPVDIDRALVAKAQRGDRAAFEQIVRRHQRGAVAGRAPLHCARTPTPPT
jgi:hypothetical protein